MLGYNYVEDFQIIKNMTINVKVIDRMWNIIEEFNLKPYFCDRKINNNFTDGINIYMEAFKSGIHNYIYRMIDEQRYQIRDWIFKYNMLHKHETRGLSL